MYNSLDFEHVHEYMYVILVVRGVCALIYFHLARALYMETNTQAHTHTCTHNNTLYKYYIVIPRSAGFDKN